VTKTYNVTLVAKVPGGCSDSITKAVTVNANPSSDFTYLLGGRQVSFTASEPGATKYEWTFGDGEKATTTSSKQLIIT
jgi:PKD repeat protein